MLSRSRTWAIYRAIFRPRAARFWMAKGGFRRFLMATGTAPESGSDQREHVGPAPTRPAGKRPRCQFLNRASQVRVLPGAHTVAGAVPTGRPSVSLRQGCSVHPELTRFNPAPRHLEPAFSRKSVVAGPERSGGGSGFRLLAVQAPQAAALGRIPDLMVVAIAELAGLVVPHHDTDFELIADVSAAPRVFGQAATPVEVRMVGLPAQTARFRAGAARHGGRRSTWPAPLWRYRAHGRAHVSRIPTSSATSERERQ
jgi:hypothetical protein